MNNFRYIVGDTFKILIASLLLLGFTTAFAHTGLKTSAPGDGAVVNQSPEQLHLTFTAEVQLVRLSLTDNSGKALELDFSPSTEAKTEFVIAMPQLPIGQFKVEWAAIGEDGHTVTDTFAFVVDPTATPSDGSESSEGQAH